ncbi:MAG: hypothetical protein VYD19_06495 [Myxococcota bacterium]|nr:hypothetical protein [Myxococcota bacterium]
MRSSTFLWVFGLSSLALPACSERAEDSSVAADRQVPAQAMNDLGASMPAPPADQGAPPPTFDAAPPARPAEPLEESCDEADLNPCFGNQDCEAGMRCENLGLEGAPVACCISGTRGDRAPGEVCDETEGQLQCESAVCIAPTEGGDAPRCSTPCLEESSCPTELPRCVFLPLDETQTGWCFPS